MLDISISYNRYKFLGHEFLTWLWYIIENDIELINSLQKDPVSLVIGNRIVLENKTHDAVESITIKGNDAGLEEGILSLKKGAVVTEINLSYKTGSQEWSFNIKGESLNISSLKTPETGPIEKKQDIEGVVIEKIFLFEKITKLIDSLYKEFIKKRLSNDWSKNIVPAIKKWISLNK